MTREEVKKLLKIPLTDTSKDEYIDTILPLAEEFVKSYCNNNFTEGYPGSVKMAIAKIIESYERNFGITSERIDSLGITYLESSEIPASILSFLKPYRKVKFI